MVRRHVEVTDGVVRVARDDADRVAVQLRRRHRPQPAVPVVPVARVAVQRVGPAQPAAARLVLVVDDPFGGVDQRDAARDRVVAVARQPVGLARLERAVAVGALAVAARVAAAQRVVGGLDADAEPRRNRPRGLPRVDRGSPRPLPTFRHVCPRCFPESSNASCTIVVNFPLSSGNCTMRTPSAISCGAAPIGLISRCRP